MSPTVNSKPVSDELSELTTRIVEAATRVADGPQSADDEAFQRARYDLYALAAADVPPTAVQSIAGEARIRALGRRVFASACQAGIHEECLIAAKLLREPSLTFGMIYRAYHGQVYDALMADELAWFQRADDVGLTALHSAGSASIAYVGGGALPIPAMLLAQRLGCRLVVIDPHEQSAVLARELVAKVGLDHLVRIECQRGEHFDYRDASVVYAANWISDKRGLLAHLSTFSHLRYCIFRDATRESLSFLINDRLDADALRAHGFTVLHRTERRAGLSLVSLIVCPEARAGARAVDATDQVERPARAPRTPKTQQVVDSITDLIGNTPTLRLDPAKTGLLNIDLYAKLEHLNPFGSIKDRTAWAMLRPHLQQLRDGSRYVLELSSGNAARALQAVASLHGSRLETITNRIRLPEMRRILALQGAKVSPMRAEIAPSDALGALFYVDGRAQEERSRCLYTDQYRNPNNDGTHYATTASEILQDVGRVDHFFTSVGTAGSSIGISRRLREVNPHVHVTGVVSSRECAIPGIRHMDEIFYVGPFEEQKYDQLVGVTADEAIDGVLALIRDFGVMAGPSSGATYSAALRALRGIDSELQERRTAVLIVCDRVELYLSWLAELRPSLFTD